ncbi:MAG: TonB-dependent receptor [Lewinellaceae bacterium]|nr:TonB-dependent receptor [Lewinellaceae bacterium]
MRNYTTFLLFCLLPTLLFSQKGTVRGNVFDKTSAAPVGFATVGIPGTGLGATTDLNGFFTISNVPVGPQKLKVSFIGFADYEKDIEVKKGEILYENIFLEEGGGTELEEVVVSGKRTQAKAEVQISKIAITAKQIRALPSAGGQADVAQYLTVLPGVVFTGDQGGQLYIRGGSPVQNRILLDGMTIYNPFHSIGFFSVFETELIRNVDVLTGGFNADYGGRISAVVDVKTREGNRKRLAGMVSASPFQAKALIEGPVIKLKETGGASVSFVLTGKKSLIDQSAPSLYAYVGDTTDIFGAFEQSELWKAPNRDTTLVRGIPFEYRDLYGKVTLLTGNGSKLNLFGFNYTDGVNYGITNFGWKSSGGGMDFTVIPANSNTIIGGVIAVSGYESQIEDADRLPRNSSISGYSAGLNFTNFGRDSELKYGIELNGFKTVFEFINFKGYPINQTENTTEISTYAKFRRKFGPLVIEPGIRLQYYQSLNDFAFEPRLGLKYNITDRLRFKAAGGLYSQNLLSTVNERDIVNLFVGFLSGPEEAIYKPGTEPGIEANRTENRIQKSIHAVSGFEVDVTDNFDLNVEGYYKRFTQLIALNRNKLEATDPNFITETGDAYGIDVSVKVEGKRYYIWGAYSLGYVTRDDGKEVYPPVFDRRHNLNIVSTYQLGKKKEWEAGVRWNFGSGFPFTQTQGFYNNVTFDDGVNTDVLGGNSDPNDVGIIYADKRNGGRLPYYHRMDVSIKRIFKFSKFSNLELTASATNVYNRPNIFYFDRLRYTRVNQLPILPSLSATFQF